MNSHCFNVYRYDPYTSDPSKDFRHVICSFKSPSSGELCLVSLALKYISHYYATNGGTCALLTLQAKLHQNYQQLYNESVKGNFRAFLQRHHFTQMTYTTEEVKAYQLEVFVSSEDYMERVALPAKCREIILHLDILRSRDYPKQCKLLEDAIQEWKRLNNTWNYESKKWMLSDHTNMNAFLLEQVPYFLQVSKKIFRGVVTGILDAMNLKEVPSPMIVHRPSFTVFPTAREQPLIEHVRRCVEGLAPENAGKVSEILVASLRIRSLTDLEEKVHNDRGRLREEVDKAMQVLKIRAQLPQMPSPIGGPYG